MSDSLAINLQRNKEELQFQHIEENLNNYAPNPQMKSVESFDSDTTVSTKEVKIETERLGFTNKLSAAGAINRKNIENKEKPVVDTRYLKKTADYKEVSKDEKLTDLKNEFEQEKYKRKKFFGGYAEDSAEMVEVKTRLKEMVSYLNEPVQVEFMEDSAQILSNLYRELIKSCNNYLGDGTKGKRTSVGKLRRNMVERILNSAKNESALIVSIAKNTEAAAKARDVDVENMTWENMLFECRASHYSNKKGDDIGVVGGGTSTIFVVKNDNKSYFFKEREKLKEDTAENKEKGALDNLAMQKTLGKITENDANWIEEKIKVFSESFKKDVKAGMSESLAKAMMICFIDLGTCVRLSKVGSGKYNQGKALDAFLRTLKRHYGIDFKYEDHPSSMIISQLITLFDDIMTKKTIENGKEKVEKEDDNTKIENKINAVKIGLGSLAKEYQNTNTMGSGNVKMPEGATITNNNVVTSRMANMLGVSDIVAKSETTVLNIDGKTMVGNLMEGVDGEYIDKRSLIEEKACYSGNAKKQLLSLSVLDYILGQTDRHSGNFLVTHEKRGNQTVITGIKGIDNDACCGMLSADEIEGLKEEGYSCLKTLTNEKGFNLPAIDYKFAQSIMALTPDALMYEFADLLKPEQISSIMDRLSFVQSKVGEVIAMYDQAKKKGADITKKDVEKRFNIKVLETEGDWERYGSSEVEEQRLKKYNPLMFNPDLKMAV